MLSMTVVVRMVVCGVVSALLLFAQRVAVQAETGSVSRLSRSGVSAVHPESRRFGHRRYGALRPDPHGEDQYESRSDNRLLPSMYGYGYGGHRYGYGGYGYGYRYGSRFGSSGYPFAFGYARPYSYRAYPYAWGYYGRPYGYGYYGP